MSSSTIDADEWMARRLALGCCATASVSDHARLVPSMLVAPPSSDSSSSSWHMPAHSIVLDNDHDHAHADAAAVKAGAVAHAAPTPALAARTSPRASTTRTRGKSKAGSSKAPSKMLPKGHKPARGRGRTKQLQMMTKDQKKAEDAILRERCRQAARDFRLRRKNKISTLQDSLDHYKNLSETQAREITKLKANAAKLRAGRRKAK